MSAAVDFTLSPDSLIESLVGPGARVLGPKLDRGVLALAIERDGEVEYISLRDAVRQVSFAARETRAIEPFGSRHELLAWVPSNKRQQALEMEAHLADVLVGRTSSEGEPRGTYEAESTTETQRRAAKVEELKISQSTMTRRIQDFQESGVLGLVGHADRLLETSGALDVDPQILAVARDFVTSRVLDSRKDLASDYALLVDDLRRRGLLTLHRDDAVGPPLVEEILPFEKFKKMVRHLNRGRNPRTAKTRQQQANRPLVSGRRHRAFDFGDVVEMDSTPLDVLVGGANGPIRAHAVFAICVATRYLWVRVVAGAPRGRDLALLLWDMAGGESAMVSGSEIGADVVPNLPRRTVTVNAWRNAGPPPASLPGCVVLDHGAEEENGRFIRYLAQLGITIRWARTRNPADKAYVESSISDFARMCQLLPGHKGNTVENRFATDPTNAHLPTMDMLHAAIPVWQHIHANTPHTGLPHPHRPGHFLTPMEAVCTSVTRGIPIRGFTDATRALGLLEHKRLTPQDDGITIGRRRYTGPGYEDVIQASLARNGRRSPVTFYFDPNRPGRLYWPIPGQFEVHVFTTPEENADVVMPFADIRADWLAAIQGHKQPTGHQRALERATLLAAMNDAMAGVEGANNVVALRVAQPAPRSRQQRSTFGWDLTADADLLDADLLDDGPQEER